MSSMKSLRFLLVALLASCASGETEPPDDVPDNREAEAVAVPDEPTAAADAAGPPATADSRDAPAPADPAPAPRAAKVAAPTDKAAAKAAAKTPSGAPFVAVNAAAQPLLPQGFTAGSFDIAGNCLVLRTEAGLYTPVMPAGSRLQRSGDGWRVSFAGKSVAMGERVNLEGGAVAAASVKLKTAVPGRCPGRLFGVAS